MISVGREVWFGTGQWNLNKTVGWGWDITNFVWWVGIGHAGTLISAILLLFRQGWRTGVNRAAEAMTIFAVMCAGQFPIWHMGRVWNAFFTLPYPNTRGPLWVNFNSPLLWDVFAISTYFTVLFASVGMVLTFCYLCQLAPFVKKDHFHPRATDDLFVMAIECTDKTNDGEVSQFLTDIGAKEVNTQLKETGWWIGSYADEKKPFEKPVEAVS